MAESAEDIFDAEIAEIAEDLLTQRTTENTEITETFDWSARVRADARGDETA